MKLLTTLIAIVLAFSVQAQYTSSTQMTLTINGEREMLKTSTEITVTTSEICIGIKCDTIEPFEYTSYSQEMKDVHMGCERYVSSDNTYVVYYDNNEVSELHVKTPQFTAIFAEIKRKPVNQ